MSMIVETNILEIIKAFPDFGKYIGYKPVSEGHINDTYIVEYEMEDGSVSRYLLQRINVNVFKKLYSYFFVFGYYMRNISNKEIIGTVKLKELLSVIENVVENAKDVQKQFEVIFDLTNSVRQQENIIMKKMVFVVDSIFRLMILKYIAI